MQGTPTGSPPKGSVLGAEVGARAPCCLCQDNISHTFNSCTPGLWFNLSRTVEPKNCQDCHENKPSWQRINGANELSSSLLHTHTHTEFPT